MITAEATELIGRATDGPTRPAATSFLEKMAVPQDAIVNQFLLKTMVAYADYLAFTDKSGKTQNEVSKIYSKSEPYDGFYSFLNFFYHEKTGWNLNAFTGDSTVIFNGEKQISVSDRTAYQFIDRPFSKEKYINITLRVFQEKLVGVNTFTSPEEKVAVRMLMDFAIELIGTTKSEDLELILRLFNYPADQTREHAFSRVLSFVTGVLDATKAPEKPQNN